ncbi:hypothetical protein PanWU01x14_259770, partial [Parasponia andersonii]
ITICTDSAATRISHQWWRHRLKSLLLHVFNCRVQPVFRSDLLIPYHSSAVLDAASVAAEIQGAEA